MPPVLETDRLLLRPLELADAEQVQAVFPQWEIVQFLTNKVPWPFPEDGVAHYYSQEALPAMERGDEWHWTLRLKQEPRCIIGSIGVFCKEDENRGFWLAPPMRGQGLMTEAVVAVTDFWFDVLGFPVLRAPKAVANTGSRRISENTGMRIVSTGERDFVSGRLPSEVWEVTSEAWRAWRIRSRKTRQRLDITR